MTDSDKRMGDAADLLIELGCEELPPKALDTIRDAFISGVSKGLENNGISFDPVDSRAYSTPRRLALHFKHVAARQPDQELERRGPALQAAFDQDGKPTGAALGFARSVGKDVSELETLKTDKGEWLFVKVHQPGKPLRELIYPILEQALKQLPVPKPMRWADHDFSFVRPVHWFVLLHGEEVIDGELLGLEANRLTRGHRIHSPGPHSLKSAGDFIQVLENARVIADQNERASKISQMLQQADTDVIIDANLLNEVTNLVEWPVAVKCSFEKEFLEVPHAALIASMQDHQKFFPVRNPEEPGEVINRFVAISNIESLDESAVREGYERVIRPRLADAQFFLEQDRKQPLEAYLPRLDKVVFQQKIGTIGDKSRRMASVSGKIADFLSVDSEASGRAALLAKCDLMTLMVGEFPELQGNMGRYYAKFSGESDEVATAIGEHYSPRFAGDDIPSSAYGQVVSIADRLDSLVGIFTAGLRPSGNKDPFALRRAALGLVRILIEAGLELPLNRLVAFAADELSEQLEVNDSLLLEVREFIAERLRHYYREQGFSAELINAALASAWDTLPDLDRRLRALSDFMGQEAALSLAAANKRIGNILRKSEQDISEEIDTNSLNLTQEVKLFDEINNLSGEIGPLLETGDYASSLLLLARLREPVDAFFDSVMVMDEDPVLRNNRLALLARLKALFDRIADLSVLG